MRKGNHPIKVIQSPTTPVKYIQNYPNTNNSAIDLIPEYYDQKELEPSPSLNYNKYINNNYYKVQTYQKNSNESDDDSSTSSSSVSNLVWKLNSSYSPTLPAVIKPYLNSISFSSNALKFFCLDLS